MLRRRGSVRFFAIGREMRYFTNHFPSLKTMDNNSTEHNSVSPARNRSLKSSKKDGTGYHRWTDVEEEIRTVVHRHESEWIREAPNLQNETLVFLIRHIGIDDGEVYGQLFSEISRRIHRLVPIWTYVPGEVSQQFVIEAVGIEVLKLVLP